MPTNDMTYQKLVDIVRQFPPRDPDPLDWIRKPTRFMGMDVIVNPYEPPQKVELRDITLSDGTKLFSPEFRAETNLWLLERFGRHENILKDKIIMMGSTLMMSPKHWAMAINVS